MPDADQLLLGSLCTGYGGLDLACRDTLGTRTAWVAENDPHAAKVCRARFKAPNLGDIKTIDWTTIQPVDVLTAGYPCQPFSHAGKRRGADDPRHIWPYIAEGVRHLRPRLIVLENVAGHLTKGFGEVVGTLAAMGYDATWGCVRASDAGAPHQRKRVFVVAADADRQRHRRGQDARVVGSEDGGVEGEARERQRARQVVEHRSAPAGGGLKLLPTPVAQPSQNTPENHLHKKNRRDGANRTQVTDIEVLVRQQWGDFSPGFKLLPTPTVVQGRNATSGRTNPDSEHHDGWTLNDVAFAAKWGDYAAAVARWEPIIDRPAPEPVDPKGRLSPVFVEWMMGLPAGWVTAVTNYPKVNVSGEKLARSHMLKILGNGVVPQQATLALHHLLPRL